MTADTTPDVVKLAAEMREAAVVWAHLECRQPPVCIHGKSVLALLDAFDARGQEIVEANARADGAERENERLAAELETARKRYECPINLHPAICSAGTCAACSITRYVDFAREIEARATAAEATLATARETIGRLCEALFMCAPHHQGGNSKTGEAVSKLLGVPFPIRMPDLEKAALAAGLEPRELWPWLFELRALASVREGGDD